MVGGLDLYLDSLGMALRDKTGPNEMLKGHLDGLLLSVVAEGEAHGYVLIERLRERSTGEFDLPEGTVYPALHRLEAGGFLRSTWVDGGRRRRVYEITDKGLRSL